MKELVRTEMRDLSAAEIEETLGLDVSAALACIGSDGYPRIIPCWFLWDGEAFYTTSIPGKYHVRQFERDPHTSFCVEVEEQLPDGSRRNRQVKAVGLVEILEDVDGEWLRRIREKYLGKVKIEETSAKPTTKRLLLRLKPERLTAHGGGIQVRNLNLNPGN